MTDYELVDIELEYGEVLIYIEDDLAHKNTIRFSKEAILNALTQFVLKPQNLEHAEPYP